MSVVEGEGAIGIIQHFNFFTGKTAIFFCQVHEIKDLIVLEGPVISTRYGHHAGQRCLLTHRGFPSPDDANLSGTRPVVKTGC